MDICTFINSKPKIKQYEKVIYTYTNIYPSYSERL